MPKPIDVGPDYFTVDRNHQRKSYEFLDCLFDRERAWRFEFDVDFDCKAQTFKSHIKKWAVRNDCYVAVKIEKGGKTVTAQAFELTDQQRWYRRRVQEGSRKRTAARRLRELHERSKETEGETCNGSEQPGSTGQSH